MKKIFFLILINMLNSFTFDIVPTIRHIINQKASLSLEQLNKIKSVLVNEFIKKYKLTEKSKELHGSIELNKTLLNQLLEIETDLAKDLTDTITKRDEKFADMRDEVYKDEESFNDKNNRIKFNRVLKERIEEHLSKIDIENFLIAPKKDLQLRRLEFQSEYLRILAERTLLSEIQPQTLSKFKDGILNFNSSSEPLQEMLIATPESKEIIHDMFQKDKIKFNDFKSPILIATNPELVTIYLEKVINGKIKLKEINVWIFKKLLNHTDFRNFLIKTLDSDLSILCQDILMNIQDILKYNDIRSAIIENLKTFSIEEFKRVINGTIGSYALIYSDFQNLIIERAEEESDIKNSAAFKFCIKQKIKGLV